MEDKNQYLVYLVSSNDIRDLEKVVNNEDVEATKERTFGSLKKDFNRFQEEFYGR